MQHNTTDKKYNPIPYNTIQCNVIQYKKSIAMLYNAMQNNTKQYSKMQCSAMKYNAIQYNTIHYITIQCNAMQYNTIQQHKTKHYNTIHYNTMQCIATQRNAMFYNTMDCNLRQCNVIQYNTKFTLIHIQSYAPCITYQIQLKLRTSYFFYSLRVAAPSPRQRKNVFSLLGGRCGYT